MHEDIRSFYDKKFIYAHDLNGKDHTVTIKEVKQGQIRQQDGSQKRQPIVYFVESKDDRGLGLNATNRETIAGLYGYKVKDWIGKKITLYPTTCPAFGITKECIRIRPIVPKETKTTGESS